MVNSLTDNLVNQVVLFQMKFMVIIKNLDVERTNIGMVIFVMKEILVT